MTGLTDRCLGMKCPGCRVVTADVNDGISSNDGLIVAGGIIDINAVDDGTYTPGTKYTSFTITNMVTDVDGGTTDIGGGGGGGGGVPVVRR